MGIWLEEQADGRVQVIFGQLAPRFFSKDEFYKKLLLDFKSYLQTKDIQ